MLRTSLPRPLRQLSSSSSSAIWRNIHQRQIHNSSDSQKAQVKSGDVVDASGTHPEAPSAATSSSTVSTGQDGPLAASSSSIPLSAPSAGPLSSSLDDKLKAEVKPEQSSKPPTPLPLPTYHLDEVKQRLRSLTEHAAIAIRNRADEFTASTKTTFSQLGAHLNKVTGYEEIEALKRDVVGQEQRINDTRREARQAKAAYEEAVIQRSKSQREVNDLLQRKSTWTDNDVSRFTTLVRQDHLYEQEEQRAKAAVDESEDAVEKEFSQLMRLILARYHEEQVWSDKIRSASTYGQLAALGLNLLVFILAIILVEPWKRKRLVQTFERKVEELSEDYAKLLGDSMRNIEEKLAGHEGLLIAVAGELAKESLALPSPVAGISETNISEPLPVLSPPPLQVETPKSVHIPGLDPIPRRTVEIAAVGTGMFILGAIASFIVNPR